MDKRLSITTTKSRSYHTAVAKSGGVVVASASHQRKSVAIQQANAAGAAYLNAQCQPAAPRIPAALLALAESYNHVAQL